MEELIVAVVEDRVGFRPLLVIVLVPGFRLVLQQLLDRQPEIERRRAHLPQRRRRHRQCFRLLRPQPFSSRSGKRSAALSSVMSAPNSRHAAGLENTMRPCAMPQTASRLSRNSGASAAPEISTFSISAVFPFRAGLLPVSYHKFCGVDTTIFCFLRSFGVRRCFLYIFTN